MLQSTLPLKRIIFRAGINLNKGADGDCNLHEVKIKSSTVNILEQNFM